jgi:Transposase
VLAELVRLDRAHHRPVAGDSATAEHIRVLTRAHQSLIWSRQRQTNALRSMLREFYPAALAAFGEDLAGREALAVLALAPSPAAGRRLSQSKIAAALRRAGRQRGIDASAERISAALRAAQLQAPPGVVAAYAAAVCSLVAVIDALVTQTEVLREQVEAGFGRHPDAEIYLSQPGLGPILGARVLAEFGDDPTRYADAKARKNYSGHGTDHPGLGHPTDGAGPPRPQPPAGQRPLLAGLRRAQQLAGSAGLLRHPARPRRHPSSGPAGLGQPTRRHPARLPAPPHRL